MIKVRSLAASEVPLLVGAGRGVPLGLVVRVGGVGSMTMVCVGLLGRLESGDGG